MLPLSKVDCLLFGSELAVVFVEIKLAVYQCSLKCVNVCPHVPEANLRDLHWKNSMKMDQQAR